jgi:hypothetical protein
MRDQVELFNRNESLSLLDELTALQPEKNLRKTEFLRDPDATIENYNWAFIVPKCFNDALDIKKTLRIKDKIKQEIWTQGSTFFFNTGDILYSKKEAYINWYKAISEGLYAIQVTSGRTSIPGKKGKKEGNKKEEKDRDKGEVTFTVYQGCKKENILKKEGVYTTTQDDFIKILVNGLDSVSLKKQ